MKSNNEIIVNSQNEIAKVGRGLVVSITTAATKNIRFLPFTGRVAMYEYCKTAPAVLSLLITTKIQNNFQNLEKSLVKKVVLQPLAT